MQKPVDPWLPRTLLLGVLALSASPLLIVEMFPSHLKFALSPSAYLTFHNIAEFFSIMVSLSMFGLSWFTYEQSKNRHALFLGTAFLAIGILDFMHTMSMPAMPNFITPNDPQKSVQFWMPVRLFQGGAFLASAYVYPDKPVRWLSKKILITSSLLISSLVFIGVIFFQTHMPTFFILGVGVTSLKKFCEYVVIFLFCAAAGAYWRRMERTGDRVIVYYLAALVVSVFSELPLAFYAKAFDTYNVLGHINKIIAFFLIYYGIYRASVKEPYIKLAETGESLKLQADQYATMLSTSSDGFWRFDTEGKLLEVNDNYCRMSGYTRAELLNLHVADIEARETPERAALHIAKVMKTGFDRFETRHRTKAGGTIDVEVSVSFWQAAGQMLLFVRNITNLKEAETELANYHHRLEELVKERTGQLESANAQLRVEISERMHAEETLRLSEEKFAKAFAINPAAIAITRLRDGLVIEANETWQAMFGYSRDEVIGRSTLNLQIWPTPEARARYAAAVREKGSFRGWEETLLRKSGESIVTLGSAEILTVAGEEVFLSTWLDITGRKQMEEELRKSRDALELRVQERTKELAKSQERLQHLSSQLLLAQEKERKRVAVELHDGLLSELAATKYLLEGKIMLLGQGKISDPGEFKRVIDVLATTMKEARRIMNNLHPAILDELGLIAAISWLSGEYQRSYPHIKVLKQIEVSEGDIPDGIRAVIFRVLQEALNNFAKHGRGDRVELLLLKSVGTFAFTMRDNGKGFDMENAPKGLGLESMRERVELSGGEFRIESTIGRGTTIRAFWSRP